MEGNDYSLREKVERANKSNLTYGQTPERKEAPDGFTRFLWWMATVDPEVMQDCGPERERYRIIGMSVMVTWLFATLAWGYFFSTILDDELAVGGLAIFFGLAILAIDRNLIAAMSKNKGSSSWLPVIFRLGLAVTIGLFLSQPIVLMLFQKDIQSQILLNKEKKMETFRQQVITLNAPLTADYQSHIKSLQAQEVAGDNRVLGLKDSYIKETDGTGGSGKIGEAAVARVKRAEYLKAQDAQDQLKQTDDPQIALYQSKLDTLEAQNKVKEAEYATNMSTGFLAQVEALTDLLKEHPPLRMRYQLVILIITLIEVLPVLSKLLLPKGEYEARVQQRMELGIYRANLNLEREKELEAHFAEKSMEADKGSIDQFFDDSRTTRENLGKEVVRGQGASSYSQLWKKFQGRVMSSSKSK
jgi:hypothetical protein